MALLARERLEKTRLFFLSKFIVLAFPVFGKTTFQDSQTRRHLISDAHEWIKEVPTVPIHHLAKPQPRERAELKPHWMFFRGKEKQEKRGVAEASSKLERANSNGQLTNNFEIDVWCATN